MPELPEIEHLKRTLEPHLVGATVTGVTLHRRDIVRRAGSRQPMRGVRSAQLLDGTTIEKLVRRGKSLAIVGAGRTHEDGAVLGLHMGMTGQMLVMPIDAPIPIEHQSHLHCEWTLRPPGHSARPVRLIFRDPRRFGGLWPFASMSDLLERAWSRLGPDALTIDDSTLRERLLRTRQPMKAALLNQALVAGVGNIYADESLFAAGIHPLSRPSRVRADQWTQLARAIRSILHSAIESGGSTVSSYRDATGRSGVFALQHQVYERGGEACRRCGLTLRQRVIGQRTTVWCERCQSRSFVHRRSARGVACAANANTRHAARGDNKSKKRSISHL